MPWNLSSHSAEELGQHESEKYAVHQRKTKHLALLPSNLAFMQKNIILNKKSFKQTRKARKIASCCAAYIFLQVHRLDPEGGGGRPSADRTWSTSFEPGGMYSNRAFAARASYRTYTCDLFAYYCFIVVCRCRYRFVSYDIGANEHETNKHQEATCRLTTYLLTYLPTYSLSTVCLDSDPSVTSRLFVACRFVLVLTTYHILTTKKQDTRTNGTTYILTYKPTYLLITFL